MPWACGAAITTSEEGTMRGRLTIIVLAGIAVAIAFVASGRSDPEAEPQGVVGRGRRAPAGALKSHLRLLAREGEAAGAADQALQRRAAHQRRAGRRDRRQDHGLRRRGDADRPGQAAAGAVVAGVLVLGPPAQLRGRPPAGRRREPVDRAHAARDRDVEASSRTPTATRSARSATRSSPSSPPAAGRRSASRSSATSSTSTPTRTSRPPASPRSPPPTTRRWARRKA